MVVVVVGANSTLLSPVTLGVAQVVRRTTHSRPPRCMWRVGPRSSTCRPTSQTGAACWTRIHGRCSCRQRLDAAGSIGI